MGRAINASELMLEIQACNWDSDQDRERAEDLVLGMPTLTPPNEPLTCDGCVDCKRSSMSMCKFCIRNTELRDYYRRPPEGEEDT